LQRQCIDADAFEKVLDEQAELSIARHLQMAAEK